MFLTKCEVSSCEKIYNARGCAVYSVRNTLFKKFKQYKQKFLNKCTAFLKMLKEKFNVHCSGARLEVTG
jgi:hypothetical protein